MIEKLQLMPWLVILTLCIEADTRKILIPKIEINMMLQELSSQEAKDFMKKSQNTSNSDSINNSTLSSEDADDSSTDLISSVVSVPPESSDAVTTPDSSDFNEPEAVTPSRPMMLSEFASHLAGGIRQRVETTTLPLPEFPTPKSSVFSVLPDDTFPDMVAEAKDFIRRYLSPEQWRKLRILLRTMKEVGGSRQDIHRAATVFISKVISKSEMAEITERKQSLFETFNKRYFAKA